MHQFRVTKYNPSHRNQFGHYTQPTWTAFTDIGNEYNGSILTLTQYERFEYAYVQSALAFIKEAGLQSLSACGVENRQASISAPTEGQALTLPELAAAMRGILREEFWCRLEETTAFIHFGRDYYMYIGVPTPCKSSCLFSSRQGLFVEPFESPYQE